MVESAFILPDPENVAIRTDAVWHEFGHTSGSATYIEVNVGSNTRKVALSNSKSAGANCVQSVNDRLLVARGAKFYINWLR